MGKFKPLKELVKALTYIGDAIAGNVKTNADNSEEYYSIELIPFYDGYTFTTFDLIIDESANFSKLGDIFSDNTINDINYIRKTYEVESILICRKYNIRDEVVAYVSVEFVVEGTNTKMIYSYRNLLSDDDMKNINFEIELSALSDDLTKDTLLTKVTTG